MTEQERINLELDPFKVKYDKLAADFERLFTCFETLENHLYDENGSGFNDICTQDQFDFIVSVKAARKDKTDAILAKLAPDEISLLKSHFCKTP